MGRSPLLYDVLTSPVDNDAFFLRDDYAREVRCIYERKETQRGGG